MKKINHSSRLMMLALIMAVLHISVSTASAGAAKAKKVASVEGITEYQLENGFRYLVFPDPSSATVTINMTVFVGSRHEGYGETGMAHLLEHMLFKGSKLFPQPDKALQAHGASRYNGTTWVDRTNYYETMPASDKNLEFGIKFEADRLVNCFVKREDLAKEMTVVRNEFEIGENNPIQILRQRIMAVAFEWHNYGQSTIGNRADIERVPIESLQAFYRKYYQPDNAMLVIAGKFDEKKAHEFVAQYFGAIPKPERELPKTYTDEPAQDGERVVVLRRTGMIGAVGVVYHTPAAAHADCAAAQVLANVLTSQPSGRLYKALVETKKATAVGGGAFAWHDPGVLMILALVGDKSTPEEVRNMMLNLIEELPQSPITEKEVERAKKQILAERERKLANTQRLAIELSEWAGAGDWRLMFIHRDRIAKMTAEHVNEVAAEYLKKSNRTVGMFIPTKATEIARADIPPTPNVQDLVEGYKGGKSLAQGEDFDPTPENIEKRVRRTQVQGGLEVALLPKKTRGEKVVASLILRFGNARSLTGLTTAIEYLGPMLTKGTKNYSRQELKDELDKLGATLSTNSSLSVVTVSLEAKRNTLPKVLDLLEEVLRRPTFPEKEFEILRRANLQSLKDALTDPVKLALNKWSRKLNPYPKDSVHYVPTIEEDIELNEKVTVEQVAQLYGKQLHPAAGGLAIVGDFDAEKTLARVKEIFSDWQSAVPFRRIGKSAHTEIAGSSESILTPDKKNAIFLAGYQLAMKDSDPRYPAMKIANYILGGSGFNSLLVDTLREKKGYSYGAASQLSVSPLDDYSAFYIFAFCNPGNINKVDGTVRELLQDVAKNGVTKKQLDDAVKGYLLQQKVNRSNDSRVASTLRQGLYLDRTYAYAAEQEEKIANLTLAEVNEAFRELIQLKRLVVVRAGDLAKAEKTNIEKK